MVTGLASFLQRIRLTLDMIKFEHSVFALPFALTAALLAWREEIPEAQGGSIGQPVWLRLIWIVVAMVAARSVGMAFNRILDAAIDARNPRTQSRHLPAGVLSTGFAWGFLSVCALVFFLAARQLNPLCLKLAPLALGVLMFYSYTKRFTLLAHLVLGFSLGIAPAAAWIAMRGTLDMRILWMTAAVTLWTAGFDIIYSCQDYEFDVASGLHSIPQRIGIASALWVSRLFHVSMVVCLLLLTQAFGLGALALAGVALVAGMLLWEHHLVRADDLSKVDAAFFTVNGYVSVIFLMFWAAEILLHTVRR